MPLVSVIVPNYNHAPFLKQRIDSILNQTFQDFELILLDDCSTDHSREVLESYRSNPHVTHLVINETNSGTPFKQWDKGIALSRGEWIWIAESDDWADATFLQELVDAAAQYDSCGLCFCESRIMDIEGNLVYEKEIKAENSLKYSAEDYYIRHRFFIDNVGQAIFKKNCVPEELEVRRRYESLKYCGDMLFYIMLLGKCDAVYVPKFLSNYRKHSDSISGQKEDTGFGIYELVKINRYLKPRLTKKQILYNSVSLIKMFNRKMYHHMVTKEVKTAFLEELWRFDHVGWCMYWPISLGYCVKRIWKNA